MSVLSGATLAVNVDAGGWNSTEIGNLLGATPAAFASGSNLGIEVTTGSFTYANNIGATQAAKGLVKSGAGTLVLSSASNNYTGPTTVSNGKLIVDGNISTSSLVTVQTGATLGGIGTVGAVTIDSGGVFAPGNSAGTMILTSLNLGATSTYLYEMTGGVAPGAGSADLGDISGTLTIDTMAILDLVELGTYTAGNKFTLFAYDGALTGTFNGLADGATFTDDLSNPWTIDYNDATAGLNGGVSASNTYVTITAIPEPRAALLGGLGMLMLLRRRRN